MLLYVENLSSLEKCKWYKRQSSCKNLHVAVAQFISCKDWLVIKTKLHKISELNYGALYTYWMFVLRKKMLTSGFMHLDAAGTEDLPRL
jgi:hypothetical protein